MVNLLCLVLVVFSANCCWVLLLFHLYRLDPKSFEISAQERVILIEAHLTEVPPLACFCQGFRKLLVPCVRVL